MVVSSFTVRSQLFVVFCFVVALSLGPIGVGTPSNTPAASLFTSAATRHYNLNNRSSRFDTPGLTPIPANLGRSPLDAEDSSVLKRAEHVAARLYYQPSPETPHTAEIRTSLQYLRGLGRQVEYEETPGTGETLLRRGGVSVKENTKGVQSALSTTFSRQPRALFMSVESATARTPEVEEQQSGNDGSRILVEEVSLPAGSMKQEGVKEILALLCVLGAGWRRLCQVRLHF